MASYEKFNYAIRPNKRTQRKMIFDALSRYLTAFPGRRFRYVGFGSMWFSDFILAHRRLGLRQLVSIELEAGYARAKFNRPFKCVKVLCGNSSVVLPTLKWKTPSIVWLDYDYGPDAESLQDISFLASKLSSGSVLMVTYDAGLPWKTDADAAKKMDTLHEIFGDAAPPNTRHGKTQVRKATRTNYPPMLVSMLWSYVNYTLVENGRQSLDGLEWMPFFSFLYKDGARMMTIGGALLNHADRAKVQSCGLFEHLTYLEGESPFEIAVPPLTQRERTMLDRSLPEGKISLPFELPEEQIESYKKLYRYYPLLAEVEL